MSRPLAAACTLLLTAAAYGPATPSGEGCGAYYTVAPHDTLYSIARRCHGDLARIARWSHVADPNRIAVGQRLILEGDGKDEPGMAAAMPPLPPGPPPRAGLVYQMQPGDTLYSLARWAHVSVPALLGANPAIDPHKIEIGDAIRLPVGAVPPEPQRLREFGTGPGPARAYGPVRTYGHIAPAPPAPAPRAARVPPPLPPGPPPFARGPRMVPPPPPPRHGQPPPPPPRRAKPDEGPDTPGL